MAKKDALVAVSSAGEPGEEVLLLQPPVPPLLANMEMKQLQRTAKTFQLFCLKNFPTQKLYYAF